MSEYELSTHTPDTNTEATWAEVESRLTPYMAKLEPTLQTSISTVEAIINQIAIRSATDALTSKTPYNSLTPVGDGLVQRVLQAGLAKAVLITEENHHFFVGHLFPVKLHSGRVRYKFITDVRVPGDNRTGRAHNLSKLYRSVIPNKYSYAQDTAILAVGSKVYRIGLKADIDISRRALRKYCKSEVVPLRIVVGTNCGEVKDSIAFETHTLIASKEIKLSPSDASDYFDEYMISNKHYVVGYDPASERDKTVAQIWSNFSKKYAGRVDDCAALVDTGRSQKYAMPPLLLSKSLYKRRWLHTGSGK